MYIDRELKLKLKHSNGILIETLKLVASQSLKSDVIFVMWCYMI
jgi:hypothetical protein